MPRTWCIESEMDHNTLKADYTQACVMTKYYRALMVRHEVRHRFNRFVAGLGVALTIALVIMFGRVEAYFWQALVVVLCIWPLRTLMSLEGHRLSQQLTGLYVQWINLKLAWEVSVLSDVQRLESLANVTQKVKTQSEPTLNFPDLLEGCREAVRKEREAEAKDTSGASPQTDLA